MGLEKLFETKYANIENCIRRVFGDDAFEELLDAILDSKDL